MPEKDQVKPLASPATHLRSDDDQFLPPPAKLRLHRNKYIMCSGCFAALLLILAVIGIVLGFTVLHIKTPDLKIDKLSFSNTTSNGGIIIVASVFVRNPNVASFKYSKATMMIYYHGAMIGEGETPGGEAKAKDTMTMNVTVEIKAEEMDEGLSLMEDLKSGGLNISSYMEIPGRVKIIGFIKKMFEVKLECSFTYNAKTQTIEKEDCDERVKISD
ncbi:uncharacterized protein LOC111491239 [Cucurbita maxima]|uniref:Uncharacterized protein LOC111491239 n=1 Tax=Cucurbita maxima TaxID=3661 RepID=A0A6J1K4Z4_CUCMA|nr:uncharacterized protein LOC111491239 [Cucurbita maxima]